MSRGFTYRREGDELFERLPSTLRDRFAQQTVVLADLARLLWLREVLAEGFERAIWVDADVLLFRDFDPPDAGDYLGREVWVQPDGGKLRSYPKVHNAWLQFGRNSSFLPFYIERATALLERVTPPVVPQFIGPKLLTAWHNIVAFDVEERIGMCSPVVMQELLQRMRGAPAGESADHALNILQKGHRRPLCGLNLCASYENRTQDGICHQAADYAELACALAAGDSPFGVDASGS